MNIEEIINKVKSCPNSAFFYTPPLYEGGNSFLFQRPDKIITIRSLKNLDKKMKLTDEFIKEGWIGYSLINYEAGFLFERTLHKYVPENEKLAQFFFYRPDRVEKISTDEITFSDIGEFKVKNFRLNTSGKEFSESINKIKTFIKNGDTYQVNYTLKGKFRFEGSYSGFFKVLLFNQSAKYVSFINNYSKLIISLSPELFFETEGKTIISKPMKGTARRQNNPERDAETGYLLGGSLKNRAENVMIVDLIRNDLGRISQYGSVEANDLFEVEKYESVYQMVSTVKARLRRDVCLSDILKSIFPCGSITGAPKLRTMEIIRELEKEKRGIYTGSIGLFAGNKLKFNVAIRTLCIDKRTGKGEIGLGSGIVWDSISADEYGETALKGRFLTEPVRPFEIIETILVRNKKILFLGKHIKRMQLSAEFFLFRFERNSIITALNKTISNLSTGSHRLRVTLDKSGRINIRHFPLIKPGSEVRVILSERAVDTRNVFQYFKTTNRDLYETEYRKYAREGFYDVIFLNEREELAEGSISNIFIQKGNRIYTPSLDSGILPGIFRRHIMDKYPGILEKKIFIKDLTEADKIFLTNSVRGRVFVRELYLNRKKSVSFVR